EHHLDELPQLWNVFRGDMAFVGPRPERRYFIDLIRKENPDYDYIYLMRPGLTSMATLYNGYTDSMQKMLIRLQMDLEYLQQRSLFLDVKIVLTTIVFILKGKKF
ncbi:sugar transferase, partial [Paraprevotella clara]